MKLVDVDIDYSLKSLNVRIKFLSIANLGFGCFENVLLPYVETNCKNKTG